MPNEIRDFFEKYRDAFNRLDGEAVARLYAIPSGIAQAYAEDKLFGSGSA